MFNRQTVIDELFEGFNPDLEVCLHVLVGDL